MRPIIKWVGGKQGNLRYIKEKLPPTYNKYYEPFIGGGAVLLELMPKEAVVGDTNADLINMYIQVRDDVEDIIAIIDSLDRGHSMCTDETEAKKYYYQIRESFNEHMGDRSSFGDRWHAAEFIYLNKHCFNGLYRVNSKGEFNVPFNGNLFSKSCDPNHLREVSKFLQRVEFKLSDFEETVKDAAEGDLVFFDSPYAPLNPTSFVDYTKEGFSYEDHVRLANLFKELTNRGVYCILTNHDTPLIRDLYKDFKIEVVDVRRSINRNGKDRKGTEVIITNY